MGLSELLNSISAQQERKLLGITEEQQATSLKDLFDKNNNKIKIREAIAKTLAAEAASEGELGMIAVANTIKNRASRKNKSLIDVVSEPNQYYGYTAKNRDKIYEQVKPIADKIADDLISGKLEDVTDGAEYFLLPHEKIRSWHGSKTKKIGSHTFYKEKGVK